MISSIAVRNYLTVLSKLGFLPSEILASSGVDTPRLGDPQYLIETSQYRTIARNIITLTGDHGIALDLGLQTDLKSLGVVGHTVLTCKTVRDTHRLWTKFGAVLVGILGAFDAVDDGEGIVRLTISSPEPSDTLFRFAVEEMLGLLRMIGQPLVGQPSPLLSMSLSYPEPEHAKRYRDFFACPISFSAEKTVVRVEKSWFDHPIQSYDNEFNSLCLRHCERLFERSDGSRPTSSELRRILEKWKGAELPSFEDVAKIMHLAPRTLRRRLGVEGTSFREEIDAYRAERAKLLLSDNKISPKETAFLLGFKEQSAFRHAFKSWTGLTVGEYRDKYSDRATMPLNE